VSRAAAISHPVPNRDFIGTDGPVGATVADAQTRPSSPYPTTPSRWRRRSTPGWPPRPRRPSTTWSQRSRTRACCTGLRTARVPGLL